MILLDDFVEVLAAPDFDSRSFVLVILSDCGSIGPALVNIDNTQPATSINRFLKKISAAFPHASPLIERLLLYRLDQQYVRNTYTDL
jgi:hypothetical protein